MISYKSYIKTVVVIFGFIIVYSCEQEKSPVMDLSGTWQFQMDSLDAGEQEEWYATKLNDTIQLPGSMAENGKGNDITLDTYWMGNMWNDSLWYKSPKYAEYRQPGNIKVSFWLSPEKVYYGPAWYQKEINIPEDWKNKNIFLELERPHWESSLWLDGKKVNSKNSLGTAHIYDLAEFLTPGKHSISLRIDNRIKDIDVGRDAHSISDNTQTNWNGIVGDIQLVAKPQVYIDLVKINPDVEGKEVEVKIQLKNTTGSPQEISLTLDAKGAEELPSKAEKFQIDADREITMRYSMGKNPALWDEFNPNVYQMKLVLKSENSEDSKNVAFGMREFKADGKQFAINGRPVFLRGTLECAIFPLTGYPPTEVEEWKRIFNVIKDHGLNHMRFHSWCPPEAAFIAADKTGIYLQVEASAWATIGDGEPIDEWLYKEAQDILDAYGNHPSFVMMAYGNEPHGDHHKKYLQKFVDHFKEREKTKVFTAGAGWPFMESADYFNSPAPRIQHWAEGLKSIINSKQPQTVFDYDEIVENTSMPLVAHEIGQWCVYPNFKGMSKYTGVLKPKNFEIFQKTLEENHMGQLADSLLLASGKLQALCYKADIEAALRTKNFAGFQLLDLHDFPGQGTALVGVLDAFWGEKGYISPVEYSAFSGETVPLARMEKRIFLNSDTLKASVEIAHYGEKAFKGVVPKWKIEKADGSIFTKGEFSKKDVEIGNGIPLGDVAIPLNKIEKAEQLTLSVTVEDHTNTWDVWVYPEEKKTISNEGTIRVVEKLNASTIDYLKKGGKVLLNITKDDVKSGKGGDIGVGFSSIFWNTSWTNGQKPNTLGILCNPEHPAFNAFPTEYHSNWQWWDAMSNSNAIVLDQFSPNLKPIVRIVDDWFENRRTALIFEVKIGEGKLLISGVDLHTNLSERLEAQQLLYSLKNYMAGDQFDPKVKIAIEDIQSLFNNG